MSETANDLLERVIVFVRERYPDEIDKAYEYFWEEEYPEDFLTGAALDVGFINFEDWLVCDFRISDGEGKGKSFIDLYAEDAKGMDEASIRALSAMKNSVISLYEAADKPRAFKDLLTGREIIADNLLLGQLKPGDVFGARFYEIGGKAVMGRCIYPFGKELREKILNSIDAIFKRYLKNENPEGTMEQFLKDEAYLFNTIWMSNLFKKGLRGQEVEG